MTTKAQEWVHKRNYGRARLIGMLSQLRAMKQERWITKEEQYWLGKAYDILDVTVNHYKEHNEESKRVFLEDKENV